MADVTISEERHEELVLAELFLNCLERGGVDNWDWYGEAQSEYQKILLKRVNIENSSN